MQKYAELIDATFETFDVPPWEYLSRRQEMALKFYLREYLHLPMRAIAKLFDTELKVLNQSFNRLAERSQDQGVPVSMMERYNVDIETIDDLARDLGFKPKALGNMDPSHAMECLWEVAKSIGHPGWYDGEDDSLMAAEEVAQLAYEMAPAEFERMLKSDFVIYRL